MSEFIRVQLKGPGHELTIRADQFDGDAYTKVDKPALDRHGDPAAIKFKTSVSREAAKKTTTPAKKAESPKENS